MENFEYSIIRETEKEQKVKEAFRRVEQIYGRDFVIEAVAVSTETKNALRQNTNAFDKVTNLDINATLLISCLLAPKERAQGNKNTKETTQEETTNEKKDTTTQEEPTREKRFKSLQEKPKKGKTKDEHVLKINRTSLYGKVKNAFKTINNDSEVRAAAAETLLDSIEKRKRRDMKINEEVYSKIKDRRRRQHALNTILEIRRFVEEQNSVLEQSTPLEQSQVKAKAR